MKNGDINHPTNTPAQAEYQLHSLEQTARGISFNMNSHKTESFVLNKVVTPPYKMPNFCNW